MKKHDIENIISKQIIEGLTKQEQDVLDAWIGESESNKKEYEAYCDLWKKSKDLVLSDKINVEASLKKTKHKIGFNSRKTWIVYARQAAAVLLLSIALSFFYSQLATNNSSQIVEQSVYQEIKAAYGTHTKISLADGTNVWLNSGSTLRFPISFSNAEKREVELNGEGFFDVTKNEEKPFIVNTTKINVKVYGTSFNVSAYNDYKAMTVALIEGKVSLLKNIDSGEKELMVLKPNDAVKYESDEKKLYHSIENYMEKYTAWKDGQIVFFDDHIDDVVRRLEKWYNVDISIADKVLRNYRFTATFTDESLEQVLKLLSISSPLKYKIEQAKKLPDNSFSQRKVTLSMKK